MSAGASRAQLELPRLSRKLRHGVRTKTSSQGDRSGRDRRALGLAYAMWTRPTVTQEPGFPPTHLSEIRRTAERASAVASPLGSAGCGRQSAVRSMRVPHQGRRALGPGSRRHQPPALQRPRASRLQAGANRNGRESRSWAELEEQVPPVGFVAGLIEQATHGSRGASALSTSSAGGSEDAPPHSLRIWSELVGRQESERAPNSSSRSSGARQPPRTRQPQ